MAASTVNNLGVYIWRFCIKGCKKNFFENKWFKETNIYNESYIFYSRRCKLTYFFLLLKGTNICNESDIFYNRRCKLAYIYPAFNL